MQRLWLWVVFYLWHMFSYTTNIQVSILQVPLLQFKYHIDVLFQHHTMAYGSITWQQFGSFNIRSWLVALWHENIVAMVYLHHSQTLYHVAVAIGISNHFFHELYQSPFYFWCIAGIPVGVKRSCLIMTIMLDVLIIIIYSVCLITKESMVQVQVLIYSESAIYHNKVIGLTMYYGGCASYYMFVLLWYSLHPPSSNKEHLYTLIIKLYNYNILQLTWNSTLWLQHTGLY